MEVLGEVLSLVFLAVAVFLAFGVLAVVVAFLVAFVTFASILLAFLVVAASTEGVTCTITLVSFGVSLFVQYQDPCASAHAIPSLALVYASLLLISVPVWSSNAAWLPVLLMLRPVSPA